MGIASGDPLHDRVLLWTRLVKDAMANDGGMAPADVELEWVIAKDAELKDPVKSGVAVARVEDGHAVRVDVAGLEARTTYYYAFRVGGVQSAVGRTRTLPAPNTPVDTIRFAVASCQNWQDGYYTAHAHLAKEDIDFVLFLGDYIYDEALKDTAVRPHDGNPPQTLDQYRRRHALYKTDPNLQAVHAAHPWIAIWDDHEVSGNYASQFAIDIPSPTEVVARRAAAYRAYWEHVPVRSKAPSGPSMQLYRQFVIGDLARLVMLDGRQYKSRPPCDGRIRRACEGRDDPSLSMLGDAQEKWLVDSLGSSTEKWRLLGNNVMMAPLLYASITNNDQWDGFTSERQRLLDAFAKNNDIVVFTGDLHATLMCELHQDPNDPTSKKVGIEVVGTSISSGSPDGRLDLITHAATRLPHIKYANENARGYVLCELTPDHLSVALRAVNTVAERTADIQTVASWKIGRGSSLVAA